MKANSRVALALVVVFSLGACGKSTSSTDTSAYDESASETTAAAAAGAGNVSDGGGTLASYGGEQNRVLALLEDLTVGRAQATDLCTKPKDVECSSASRVVTFNNCALHAGAKAPVWNGSMTLAFDSDATCSSWKSEDGGPTSGTMTRTFASGTTRKFTNRRGKSVTETLNTGSGLSAYDGSSVTGGGFYVTFNSDQSRSVEIKGIQVSAVNDKSEEVMNRIVKSSSNLSITGYGASRKVSSGTIVIYHNVKEFTSTSKIESALSFTAGCCFPTGGKTSTTFSNSSKTETMEFSSECGTATKTVTEDGVSTSEAVELRRCI